MKDAIDSLRSVAQSLRKSDGFRALSARERLQLDEDLRRIDGALLSTGKRQLSQGQATPADLHAAQPLEPQEAQQPEPAPAVPASTAKPPPPAGEVIGERTAALMESVDFTGFVAGLVTGTFQAIVNATGQQIREYAQLVASLARSVDDFARDNVSESQIRDWLAVRHQADLSVEIPPAGSNAAPRLKPRPGREGTSPEWLRDYGLEDETLTDELTEGPLLRAGRPRLAEERMHTLSTMVLMGIHRIVIQDGSIRAKMQFHAVGQDVVRAETVAQGIGQQVGIAGRQAQMQSASTTLVSTLKANAQADASLKADLMGEVNINFRSETFPLERFADSAAIQLLNRHARLPEDSRKGGNAAPATVELRRAENGQSSSNELKAAPPSPKEP